MQDLDPSDICKKKILNPLKRIRVIIRTPTHGRTDGQTYRQTDRRTDEQGESSIPPLNFVAWGIITSFHVHSLVQNCCNSIANTCWNYNSLTLNHWHINGLVQERCNSSALAMELPLSCTDPLNINKKNVDKYLNLLWLIDAIWQHRSESTLVHVIFRCLMALRHHLNQCWIVISRVLCHSPEGKR